MSAITRQLISNVKTLPPALQEEALHFVEFLTLKINQSTQSLTCDSNKPNGAKLAQLMTEIAQRGSAFQGIEDPAAWQREIRKDRPLPGRE
jgi:hypothetical protein